MLPSVICIKHGSKRILCVLGVRQSSSGGHARAAPDRTRDEYQAVFPERQLLLRKLAVFLRAQQQHQQRQLALSANQRSQVRRQRVQAADLFLSDVRAAASQLDVQQLTSRLAHLPAELAPPGSPAARQLLSKAAADATSALAAASGRPHYAHALLELLLDRGLLPLGCEGPAVQQVLRAYSHTGDLAGMISTSTYLQGFSDPQVASSTASTAPATTRASAGGDAAASAATSSPPQPLVHSHVLAMLLAAIGRARDSDTLLGLWQRHALAAVAAGGGWPRPRVLHELAAACVACDLQEVGAAASHGAAAVTDITAAKGAEDAGGGAQAMGEGARQEAVHAASPDSGKGGATAAAGAGLAALERPGSLMSALFHSGSSLVAAAQELLDARDAYRQHAGAAARQQQGRAQLAGGASIGRPAAAASKAAGTGAAVTLAPPRAWLSQADAIRLLALAGSVADVDALLCSQLMQPGGVPLPAMARLLPKLLRDANSGSGGSGGGDNGWLQGAPQHPYVLTAYADLAGEHYEQEGTLRQRGEGRGRPQRHPPHSPAPPPTRFPPALPPSVAAAAVRAYLRHSAPSRAAAVAHASVALGTNAAPLWDLAAGCAAAGDLVASLNALEAARRATPHCRAPPRALAAVLPALAASSAPPAGAAGRPRVLLDLWRAHGDAHPAAWGALLAALWAAGDTGGALWPALMRALACPLPYTGIVRGSPAAAAARADEAMSVIVGDLVRAMLTQPGGTPAMRDAQLVEGLPLHLQHPGLRARLDKVAAMFTLLRRRRVTIRSDAALAQALMGLALCKDTEDARLSDLLPKLLGAAASIGMLPGRRAGGALLRCCTQLELGRGLPPMAHAQGSRLSLAGAPLDYRLLVEECRQLLQQQWPAGPGWGGQAGILDGRQLAAGGGGSDGGGGYDGAAQARARVAVPAAGVEGLQPAAAGGSEVHPWLRRYRHWAQKPSAEQVAADVARTWALEGAARFVGGMMAQGPTWGLRPPGLLVQPPP